MTPADMITIAMFPAIVADVIAFVWQVFGKAPPWLCRNTHRVTTVMWWMLLIAELAGDQRHGRAIGDALCAFMGAWLWNWPKDDDDGPRRRRRQKKVEEKRDERDWVLARRAAQIGFRP